MCNRGERDLPALLARIAEMHPRIAKTSLCFISFLYSGLTVKRYFQIDV